MNTTKERREWRVTNAAAVSAGAVWYPLAESGAPTQKDYDEQFPLRTYGVDNTSNNEISIMLDPQPTTSAKRWTVPSTKSRESDPADRITYHSAHITNNGVDEIAIGELVFVMRNY